MTVHRAESLESASIEYETDVALVGVCVAQVHAYDTVVGVLHGRSGFLWIVAYAFAAECVLRAVAVSV